MTPAERLLMAAELLGRRAGEATAGPWRAHLMDEMHEDAAAWIGAPGEATSDGVFVAAAANHPDGLNDAGYIATVNPEVGKALAVWLRDAGEQAQRVGSQYGARFTEETFQEALAVADAVLAGEGS